MEPVTHLLTGACLSRTGFNRRTALATVVMTLAAEAPDLDILAYFKGSAFGFAHHRGITHTLLGVPLMAAIVVAFVWGARRLWRKVRGTDASRPASEAAPQEPRWKLLYGYACVAGLSHILLDFTNNYGVRPFWPFFNHWYSWDIVYIFEPVMLLMLAAALVLPLLFGLVNSEVGVKQKGPRGRASAVTALIGVVILWGVRDYNHRRAIAALDSIEFQGTSPTRVAAMPSNTNPFKWTGLVETEGFYEVVGVNTLNDEVDASGRALVFYKPQASDALKAAQGSYLGRAYMDWSQWPLLEVRKREAPAQGTSVVFRDLRFTSLERNSTSALSAFVDLDEKLKVEDEGFFSRNASTERLRNGESK